MSTHQHLDGSAGGHTMVEVEQVPIAGYLSRDLKIRLKTELTRREMTFSDWLRTHADRWLTELSEPVGQRQAGPEAEEVEVNVG
jgi:hypothetical protein